MYTIKCGNINGDDVMYYAIDHENFTQKFQFDYGYVWARYNKVETINVAIETNNDHFLNGVRCAVKDGLVDYKNIQIIFYNEENKYLINIDKNGNLDYWPVGFFDQNDIAVTHLIGWDLE